jgi:hypothetical protein
LCGRHSPPRLSRRAEKGPSVGHFGLTKFR